MTAELERCLPAGWRLIRPSEGSLSWSIESQDTSPGVQPYRDYQVWLSNGLDMLMFVSGNEVCGLYDLSHQLLHAMVIQTGVLRGHSVKECLEFVMSRNKPNEWNAT